MSKAKHKGYRKVLHTYNFTTTYNSETIKCKRVVWCIVDELTSRTIKTTHIAATTYIGSYKHRGTIARMPQKPISINLKNPLSSKVCLKPWMRSFFKSNEDGQRAFNHYITDDSRSKKLTGLVTWFNGDRGSIQVNGLEFIVWACNINGAKTGYPETACVKVVKGQQVTVDLADMGDYVTVVVTDGGHFDAEKWNSLNQDNLAFKKDENGKFINGLFK